MRYDKFLFLLLFLSVSVKTVMGQGFNPAKNDSALVIRELNAFLVAFRNLDFDQFKNYFADDVSVFFPPSAGVASRVDGKHKVLEVFKSFFDRARKDRTAPP